MQRAKKETKPEPNEATKMVSSTLITIATEHDWGWVRCHMQAQGNSGTLTVFISGSLTGCMRYSDPVKKEDGTWFDTDTHVDYAAFLALDRKASEKVINAQMDAMPGALIRVVGEGDGLRPEIVRIFEANEWSKWGHVE